MSVSSIIVEPAKREDLPAIHQLVRELAIYEKAESEFIAGLDDYYRDFDAGIFECMVARVNDRVAGMVLYYMTYSTWKGRMLYLEDFVVLPDYRGEGLGRKLFDAFLDRAKVLECRLVKWQVLDWNEPALNFYLKYDAIIEKEWWNGKIFL